MKEDLIKIRREKWEKWKDVFGDKIALKFECGNRIDQIVNDYSHKEKEFFDENRIVVKTAGRLISLRKMGKLTFCHLSQIKSKIQILFEKNTVKEENYKNLSLLDIGDFIGIEGYLLKTRTGELTIAVENYKPLTKCLKPLPEKWHGLQDVEQRYRQRYLDLIINSESKERFLKRIKMVDAIREFMKKRDYLEVETPMLQPIAGGATAKPFITHHNALDMDLFLRIAPELYLKRLIVGGFEKVFEINRNFRNEGIDTRHNPEFTMMEFYESYSSMDEMMKLTEELLCYVSNEVNGSSEISFKEQKISLNPPYKVVSLLNETRNFLNEKGIKESDLDDSRIRAKLCDSFDLSKEKAKSRMKFLVEVFDTFVAPKLIEPTFVVDFPIEVSPLSRKKDDEVVYRFELYIMGMEIANGFSELNDPDDQRERFLKQAREKFEGDLEAMSYDEDYCLALEYGLPPTGGEGIGIDRLAMILTDTDSIRDVLLFPLLKPEKAE